jgi:hypothetical protein
MSISARERITNSPKPQYWLSANPGNKIMIVWFSLRDPSASRLGENRVRKILECELCNRDNAVLANTQFHKAGKVLVPE